jgi:hypothetical protein
MKRRLATTALALVGLAAPAVAQSAYDKDTGTLISHPRRAEQADKKQSDDERGRDMMNQFARCIIDRSPEGVAAAIALAPGDDSSAFNRVASDECLDQGRMSFSPALLRGALFGELYRRQTKGVKNLSVKFPPQPLDWSAPPSPESNTRARTNYFMLWMSDCVEKTNGAEMRTIVGAPVGSSAQETAYAAVIPSLGPCVPAGQKLAISRAMLEAAFAEYLYRSAVPAKPAAVEKKP